MSLAAAVIAREERLVRRLRQAGATSPSKARPLEGRGDRLALRRLQKRAVVRESPNGYYVDEPSWEALRTGRRRSMAIGLALAGAIAAIGAFLAAQGR